MPLAFISIIWSVKFHCWTYHVVSLCIFSTLINVTMLFAFIYVHVANMSHHCCLLYYCGLFSYEYSIKRFVNGIWVAFRWLEIVLTWPCCILQIILWHLHLKINLRLPLFLCYFLTLSRNLLVKFSMHSLSPSLFVASSLYLLINIVGSRVDKHCSYILHNDPYVAFLQ